MLISVLWRVVKKSTVRLYCSSSNLPALQIMRLQHAGEDVVGCHMDQGLPKEMGLEAQVMVVSNHLGLCCLRDHASLGQYWKGCGETYSSYVCSALKQAPLLFFGLIKHGSGLTQHLCLASLFRMGWQKHFVGISCSVVADCPGR